MDGNFSWICSTNIWNDVSKIDEVWVACFSFCLGCNIASFEISMVGWCNVLLSLNNSESWVWSCTNESYLCLSWSCKRVRIVERQCFSLHALLIYLDKYVICFIATFHADTCNLLRDSLWEISFWSQAWISMYQDDTSRAFYKWVRNWKMESVSVENQVELSLYFLKIH